jgi:hypothetical protein
MYDIHRKAASEGRKPRIYMNPSVRVAYDEEWFVWHNYVLQVPYIKGWVNFWSRGVGLWFVDWIWEIFRKVRPLVRSCRRLTGGAARSMQLGWVADRGRLPFLAVGAGGPGVGCQQGDLLTRCNVGDVHPNYSVCWRWYMMLAYSRLRCYCCSRPS